MSSLPEFYEAVAAYHRDHPEQRNGQAHFNVLWRMRPDLSEQIRSTSFDPFYRDEQLRIFNEWLYDNWGK